MEQQKPTPSTREYAQQKFNSARGNLLLVIILTIVNIVLLLLNADVMLLFSATIPYFSVAVGMLSGESVLYVAGVSFAVITLIAYFLFWFFSKKHYGWMIAALVFFILDTLSMAGMYFFAQDFSGILDVIIHIWVLYYLVTGVKYGSQLAKMPEEIQETAFVQQQPFVAEATEEESRFDYVATPLRRADDQVKHRILIEEDVHGHHITYRRVKRINELVIDGYVYDDVEMMLEAAHSLTAKLDGHTYQVGFDGAVHSYLRVDGNTVKKKLRLY